MAPFYTRYVPQSNAPPQVGEPGAQEASSPPRKRKRGDLKNGSEAGIKKQKKGIAPQAVSNGAAPHDSEACRKKKTSRPSTKPTGLTLGRAEKPDESTKKSTTAGMPSILGNQQKASGMQGNGATKSGKNVKEAKKRGLSITKGITSKTAKETKETRKKRKDPKEAEDAVSEVPEVDPNPPDEHARIRSKFEKSKKKDATLENWKALDEDSKQEEARAPPPVELHGLEPLPQPAPIPESHERPTFSTLPSWLAHPLRIGSSERADFKSLGLDASMLESVEKQGLKSAMPVQSAVIPLLRDGPRRDRGDVCISAATGSGKTLAYVLPMIQDLKNLSMTKLRGLIVVPTRELVTQARQICEACATGTNVKIATALGSKTLADEQEVLVERYDIYDPEEYSRQQSVPVNWSEIEMGDVLDEFGSDRQTPADFVVRHRSKVDVLICTPGRLVDHLRSTKGFCLEDVRWLVIDEADRLLNESFQEWIDIVMPKLQNRSTTSLRELVLRHMRMEIPERVIQKVVMSATLTQDISKLSSLHLRNPKLVVVGDVAVPKAEDATPWSTSDQQQAGENANFYVPSTLQEHAVPVGDGTEKPLYLLELLRTKVDVFGLNNAESDSSSDSDNDSETSSSSSSSSDSESSISTTKSRVRADQNQKPPSLAKTFESDGPRSAASSTALIFTRSTESATRLSRLLSLLSAPIAALTATLTKSSGSSSTRKALTDFRQQRIRIIIATDRASRGLDLPDLGHVISYDVPTSVTTYVHRVGRTARAGKSGQAWTLLAHHEARWFWKQIGKSGEEQTGSTQPSSISGTGTAGGRIVRIAKVQRCNIVVNTQKKDDGTMERYANALKLLGEEVAGGG
jgi:ATP-dependent RNA helicase DDX51/DBP6